jgi:zinc transport system ATP-binding protein
MSEPVITLTGVGVRLQDREILTDVSLTVRKGDFYALIGPNGGGKTTLLKVILGLLTPDRGTVRICGRPPAEKRNVIGYVPQFRTFDFGYPITVKEMVLSGRLGHIPGILKRYGPVDIAHAEAALETLGISGLADREIRRLSGGEQQRVMIARALVGGPEILLLDEPTVYVDAPTEHQFFEIMDRLRSSMTVMLVTHDIGVLAGHVTRVGCLNRRLYTHDTDQITQDMLTAAYGCPVELVAHGIPHRVLAEHHQEEKG